MGATAMSRRPDTRSPTSPLHSPELCTQLLQATLAHTWLTLDYLVPPAEVVGAVRGQQELVLEAHLLRHPAHHVGAVAAQLPVLPQLCPGRPGHRAHAEEPLDPGLVVAGVLAPLGVHVPGADGDGLLLVAADHAQLQGHRQQLGLGVSVAGRRHLHTHVSM